MYTYVGISNYNPLFKDLPSGPQDPARCARQTGHVFGGRASILGRFKTACRRANIEGISMGQCSKQIIVKGKRGKMPHLPSRKRPSLIFNSNELEQSCWSNHHFIKSDSSSAPDIDEG